MTAGFFERSVRARIRLVLLKLLEWTEPHVPSVLSASRPRSLFLRDVRVPARLAGLVLGVMLLVVLYRELGPGLGKAAAIALLTAVTGFLVFFYVRRDHPEFLEDEEAVSLMGFILIFSVWAMALWVQAARMSPAISTLGVPLAAAPVLATLLLSPGLGLITAVYLSLLYGVFSGFSFDESTVQLLGGVAAVAASTKVRARRDVAGASLAVAAAQALTVLSLGLLRGWPAAQMVPAIWWALGGGGASVFLAGAILPSLESFFSRLTPMRLSELADVNHPLLRRLSLEAPGTYHHSLIVASLASAAADAVGADALLCRAGAYFHDVGKIVKPEYFVENQGSIGNPHDPLAPSMSRLVLQSHVKEGLALAREYGLDKVLADFIATHHGTSRIDYFFHRALESMEDLERVDEDDYRYPGPRPSTKETAIMMLSDGVEASVRTLEEPTPQRLRDQIKAIVDQKTADGQFDQVPLTLLDLHRITESFFNTLVGVYHNRIAYPGQEEAASPPDDRRS